MFNRFWALFVGLLLATAARADYMPFDGASVAPNIAEIHIGNDGVHVNLEVFLEDIATFEALIPDDWSSQTPTNRPDVFERMADFARNGLSIRRDDGSVLRVEALLTEPRLRIDRASAWAGRRDPITGRIFPKPPDDKRVVYVELFYDFQGTSPKAITISPPSDETGEPLASIGMVVFDRAVPATKFSFMSDDARLEIDWADPWYSSFDSPNLKRHHQSAVTTFLYVEPREVRHETLIRVRDLGDWTDLGLNGAPMMDAEAQERIKSRARAFLEARNPVTIDGAPVASVHSRASFLRISDTGLLVVENEEQLDPLSTFVGVILSFPVPSMPDKATVTWDMFNTRINRIPATVTDPAGPFFSGATPDSPVIDWTNYLLTYEEPRVVPVSSPTPGMIHVSWVSLALIVIVALMAGIALLRRGRLRLVLLGASIVCIGAAIPMRHIAIVDVRNPFAGPPDTETAAVIFSALLNNISVADLQTNPDERARELQTILSGPTQNEVTAELDRSLSIEIAGGGLAKVNAIADVTMTAIAALPDKTGFQSLAEWTVRASAGHWGHDHRRNLRYRALVEVQMERGLWKMAGITVVDIRDAN